MSVSPTTVDLPATFHPMTMAQGVRASMRRTPHKVAVVQDDRSRTYTELMERADRATNATILDLGLRPGQNVAIIARNCIEYLEVALGVPEAGVALATLNPRMTPAEMQVACDNAEAQVIFTDAQSAPAVRAASFTTVQRIIEFGDDYEAWLRLGDAPVERPVVHEWDVWTMPYTSGTTGQPKGVLISHRSRILAWMSCGVEFSCFGPDDRFLAMAPMCHGGGLSFPMSSFLGGGSVEILDRFDPEMVLRKFKYGGITGVFMVPTHFHGIFALSPEVLEECRGSGLRTIIANAAPLPQTMKRKIVPYFGEHVLNEIYSSTEAGLVTNLRPAYQLVKESCVGQPFSQTLVRVLNAQGEECGVDEVGEIHSRSPQMFNGYWKRPEETAAAFRDGWVSVGDMGRRDADGFLYIVDRKKDMVISGGVNIYPREVEDVLLEHPAISEVAVVGVPDERWGERLRAFVVLRAGQSLSAEEMSAFCVGRLSSYKIPRDLALIDALPRNTNGKVLKRELRPA